jgi:WD40 repeat protein
METLGIVENNLVIPGNTTTVTSVCVLEEGRLAIGSSDTMVQVWKTNDDFRTTINLQRSLKGHTARVSHLCMLSKGLLASASDDNTVRIWDANGECLHVLEHTNVVTSICAINDMHLVSACWEYDTDNCLLLWNFETGELVKILNGHTGFVMSVCSLGDGHIASGSLDHTVRVWDSSGVCLLLLEGHASYVTSVCSLGDGLLASASGDTTVRVWNAGSGECMHVLEGHTARVTSVCGVSNLLLVSTSLDKTVWVWDARNGAPIQVINPEFVGFPWWMQQVFNLFNGHLAFICSDNTVRFWELYQQGFPIATGGYRTKRKRMKKPYKKKKGKSRTRKRLT